MMIHQGLLNRIPIVSKVAVTLGVVLGIFFSAALGGPNQTSGRIGIGIGIALGLIAAVVAPIVISRRTRSV